MSAKELLQKYHARLAKEGWIQSTLCGLSLGFTMNIICSALFLIFGIKAFWISILVLAVGTGVSTPIFYYAKFRKSTRQVAARVDTLGLEERMLTMAQYENDDSYIARRQREDAANALRSVDKNFVKIAVSVPLVIVCVAATVIGIGTTTVSAMSETSLIEKIKELESGDNDAPEVFFDLEYGVKDDEGGRIEGDLFQNVLEGNDADPVQAIADDEYVFVGWSDGVEDAYRTDLAVSESMEVYAIFQAVEDSDSEEDGDAEKDSDKNSDSSSSDPSDPGAPGDDNGNGSGGSTLPNNQIVDGDTYYGDDFKNSFDDAQDALNSGSDISDGESGTIDGYFHNIQK